MDIIAFVVIGLLWFSVIVKPILRDIFGEWK